jgi:tRNA threonylcarbamoyladenosine modification (KEOPS) complex Cgi121 subunit
LIEGKDNTFQLEDLTVFIKGIFLAHSNVSKVYDSFKDKFKNINIVFIDPNIIFGLDHIFGIIKIIKENSKREGKKMIKNPDIEFLLRICYTNQISLAFEKLGYNKSFDNNGTRFIYILFSEYSSNIEKASEYIDSHKIKEEEEEEIARKREEKSVLLEMSENKKKYILKVFFNKDFKDAQNLFFIKDNVKFQKFLIERAAIALRQ